MTSIQEFIKTRESIEKLASQIVLFIEGKDIGESRQHLGIANHRLGRLKAMISNDTQDMACRRLSALLENLGAKIEKINPKTPIRRNMAKKERAVPTARPRNSETPEIAVFERP